MSGLSSNGLHLIWMVSVVLLIAYLGSSRFRGTMGEDRVRRLLSGSLPGNQYTVLNDLLIPSGGGTRRIPHLVVSQFGLFVVHPVHRPGRITGTRVQDLWTQRRLGRVFRFDNPIHQNELAIQALKQQLDIPGLWCHSVVVFASNTSFTGPSPEDVIPAQKLIPLIKRRGQKLLDPDTCSQVLMKLKQIRLDRGNGIRPDRWRLMRWFLLVVLLAAAFLVFREQLQRFYTQVKSHMSNTPQSSPTGPGGTQLSAEELWKSSLVCAWSSETGRCACYEPGGDKADLEPEVCRQLAEEGSVAVQ